LRVPGQPNCYRKAWVTTVTEIGLPKLHMHDVRHAAAAGLLRAGVTLAVAVAVAAQVLGHSPQVLARRYGPLETDTLRKAQEQAWAATPQRGGPSSLPGKPRLAAYGYEVPDDGLMQGMPTRD
jgi:integrase